MNGPEHYVEAERQLEVAGEAAKLALRVDAEQAIAAAQVHATLAVAAATVAARPLNVELPEWRKLLLPRRLRKDDR